MKITNFTVLNAADPIGIGRLPYFSWKLESSQDNTLQESYSLAVKDMVGETVMDTGTVKGRKNAFIPYDGKPLESSTKYTVIVTVKDNHGNVSSAETSFETGLLESGDWTARWITPAAKRKKNKKGFGKQQSSELFRQSIRIEKEIKSARLYATCHGIYEMYVNGERVDDRFFAPEHTVYEKYLCCQTYDISKYLKTGSNMIGMHVGNGWFYSPNAAPNMKTDNRLACLFQVRVVYTDGSIDIFGSDDHAESAHGPVLSSDMYAGEKYDANAEIAHWCSSGAEGGTWTPVRVEMKYGYDNLVPQNADRVIVNRELPVKEILHSPKGEVILDFGQNIAGVIRMKHPLKKGQVIRLEHCEVLDKEGNYFNNIMSAGGVGKGCDQTDEYISDGSAYCYTPHFTYHGFRYVRVTVDKKPPTDIDKDDFTALALTSTKENVGTFCCSDKDLNQLYSNIRWSQSANMLSIPTDCPQREKAGWTGDMLVYAKTAMQNEDCTILFSRWLENMELEQDEYGIIPMVVPENGAYPMTGKMIQISAGEKGKGTSSGWGDAAVAVPYAMYQITGNTEVLKRQYYCMRRWCDYILDRAANNRPKNCQRTPEIEKYLWDTGYHYGEWLIPSQNRNGMDMKNLKAVMASSSCYTAPIFGWYSVKTFADCIEILAEENPDNALYATDAPFYRDMAGRMKNAIQNGVIQPDGAMPSTLMGAYVLPIFFDLVPEKFKDIFAGNLLRSIEENGGCMDTGFLASPFLLHALCRIGRTDKAYELLWQEKTPSWLSEVKAGATTIWENCFGYDADGNPGVLSFNHYAFGSVADWIFQYVNGIVPMAPGYVSFKVCPVPDGRLTFASRTFDTINGKISVSWEIQSVDGVQYYDLKVHVPCNTTAQICLPDGKTENVGSGDYHYKEEITGGTSK